MDLNYFDCDSAFNFSKIFQIAILVPSAKHLVRANRTEKQGVQTYPKSPVSNIIDLEVDVGMIVGIQKLDSPVVKEGIPLVSLGRLVRHVQIPSCCAHTTSPHCAYLTDLHGLHVLVQNIYRVI